MEGPDFVNIMTAAREANAIKAMQDFDADVPYAIVPVGYHKIDLTDIADHLDYRQPTPARVRKNIHFVDVAGFISYFDTFKAAYKPRLFSNVGDNGLAVLCVFDYDEPAGASSTNAESVVSSSTKPRWNEHVAHLQLAYHRDYKELRDKQNTWFKQEDFALFIEENSHLFITPDAASMLELSQDLKGARNVNWRTGKRLNNSSTQLEYIETGLPLLNVANFGGIRTPHPREVAEID